MIVSYRYKLKGKRVARRLSAYARSVNSVWNYCVDIQREVRNRWKHGQMSHWPSFYTLKDLASGTSKELGIHAQTVQNVCKQFVKGRDQHKKCPKKRKDYGARRSLGWIPFQEQSRKITPGSITYLGYTYKFFGADSRPLPSTCRGGQFVEDSRGQWWVSIYVDLKEDNLHGNKEQGLDLGLKDLVTTSDGIKYENPAYFRKSEQKLKVAQRAKNRRKVSAIYARAKNQRKDYLHKLSNKLVRESKSLIVGNVSAAKLGKTRMAKSAYDASWSALRSMLRYKASRHGVLYLEVNEKFTTQTCSHCGQRPEGRPTGIAGLEIREWVCSNCGETHDRDVNAAKNILNLGRGAAPPDGGSRNFVSVEGAQHSNT